MTAKNIASGTRIRLPGGATGTVERRLTPSEFSEPLFIVRLDQRQSNGDGYDVLLEREMEVESQGKEGGVA